MTDMMCGKCGEPWGVDGLHELVADGVVVDWSDARRTFMREGCGAFGTSHGDGRAHPALVELSDMLGDDVDGLVALTEDFGIGGGGW